ncbi:electron transfer flavoprotein subunit alpha/FixB family protein [Oceanobacillus jeddahense]|uniref:Electron transfer flavoprotein subunit alpha/FixB family protein n=1 Tax=Oceanobacillus jeddahense TaxID=1462527 RepID=A0ABY5JP31_9BACI|nr:electron transfer flavoprotein subunit alpha/FixB family protein [Oceanobacillus jeddahense]UUI02039.1 electron transfer flavoprotein subunit alpha/FixB family protein [Oceanobacillus jeddahense]
MKKILVIGEIKDQELRNVSFEVITAARKAANGGEVVSVLLGNECEEMAGQLFDHGADRVVIVDHPDLNRYTTDAYKQALLQVIEKEEPNGIMMGHTSIGKDLAPRVATKLDSGLISDVIAIEEEDEELVYTTPIYSGKAFEKRTFEDDFIFITIRPNNFELPEVDNSRSGEVIKYDAEIKDIRTIIKNVAKKASEGVDLSEAKVVVAGGRGLKDADGFNSLYELADLLGAAVGASRGACDADFCDYSLQIGQTGKVVTPDLYIAVGISGAIQHLAGMSNSKVIIAINKDPEADIFGVADYGIVGDLFEIIPILIEELKELNLVKAH